MKKLSKIDLDPKKLLRGDELIHLTGGGYVPNTCGYFCRGNWECWSACPRCVYAPYSGGHDICIA